MISNARLMNFSVPLFYFLEQLQEKGKEARQWVLRNNNNYLQAKRINDLLGK